MNTKLKTSLEWSRSLEFVGLNLYNRVGWDCDPYDPQCDFDTDLITKELFIDKVMRSNYSWECSKL